MTEYEQIVELWRGFNIKTVSDLDLRLDSFRILFAYNSGKIENPEITYHDTRDVFENDKANHFSGHPTTLTEISNQKKCYEFLLPKIIAAEPISIQLIKEAHSITTMATYDNRRYFELGERPGAFKKHDFVVGKNEVGSMPEDVEGDLIKLLDEINSIDLLTPNSVQKDAGHLPTPHTILKAATYFHMCFEHIHPFADGNGRVGRSMMNYFLMIHNHPPLIVYDEDRAEYYGALEQCDESEDIEPLFDFFMRQLIKTWEKVLGRHKKRAF